MLSLAMSYISPRGGYLSYSLRVKMPGRFGHQHARIFVLINQVHLVMLEIRELAPMCEIKELLRRYVEALERGLESRASTTWCRGHAALSFEPLRKAFLTVERHRLLEGFYRPVKGGGYIWVSLDADAPNQEALKEVYTASAEGLVTKLSPEGKPTSSSSSPTLMVSMLQILDLKPGMRVLEIGTGTGYNAALMAEIVGKQELVTTLDIQPDIVERAERCLRRAGYGDIQVYCTDGHYGLPENGPYDRIVATTCCTDISPHWLNQLTRKGWILTPLRHGGETVAPVTQVYPDRRGRVLEPAGFGLAHGMLTDSDPWAQIPKPDPQMLEHGLSGRRLFRLPSPREFTAFTFHFHYFVALNEPNALFFMRPGQVMLLWDDQTREGAGLIQEDEWVRVSGSERLCKRLEEIYKEFKEFGQPRLHDYRIEFLLRSAPLEANGNALGVRRVGPREWIIERRFTSQRIWLPA